MNYRVAYLTHGARNVGGGERYLKDILSRLDRSLFSPILLYANTNHLIQELEGQVPCVHFPLSNQVTGIYRDRLGAKELWSSLAKLYHLSSAILRLSIYLRRNKIDIVHAHDNLSKLIAVPAAKLARVKVVTTCHDLLGSSPIDRFLLSVQRRFMDRVFCVSEAVGSLFQYKGKLRANARIIPNGISVEHWSRTKLHDSSGTKTIGVIGMFDEVKGHRYLLQALKDLKSQGKDFRCVLVGDGIERESIYSLVEDLGLKQEVEFLGYQKNVHEILQDFDVLAVPSVKESFGMVALEAMALEVPVVASRVGGLPEVIGDAGVLVEAANPTALSEALCYVLDNPNERNKFVQRGRIRVLTYFNFDKNLKRYEYELLNLMQKESY